MTLATYDIESPTGYDETSYVAYREIERRKIPRHEQRQHFAPGLHCCPCCSAQMLLSKGYRESAGRLLDASQRDEALKDAIIAKDIYRCGLLANGNLHPDIGTSFVKEILPHQGAPRGRKPSFRHRDGYEGHESSEHLHLKFKLAAVIKKAFQRQRWNVEIAMESQLPGSSVARTPDILVILYPEDDSDQIFLPVEVQKSPISAEELTERTWDLKRAGATNVIWLFKKNRVTGGSQRNAARTSINMGLPSLCYELFKNKDGFIGDELTVESITKKFLDDLSAPSDYEETGDGREDCQRDSRRRNAQRDWSAIKIISRIDHVLLTAIKRVPVIQGIPVQLGDIVSCANAFGALEDFADGARVKGWSPDLERLLLGWVGIVSTIDCAWVESLADAQFAARYKPSTRNEFFESTRF